MESRIARLNRIAPRRIRAQAAFWVADLHGPGRDAALEAKVRLWIAEDPRHAAAFELATEAWQRSGNLPALLPHRAPHAHRERRARLAGPAFAGMAFLCAAVAGAVYFLRDDTLATAAREQKTVELSDGTQVTLNASTRVIVQYDQQVRKVTLVRGEALFNVVKHQPRPFVVVIGSRKVIAVGTSFLVRLAENTDTVFDVTLMEGRVVVEPISWPNVLPANPSGGLKMLNPGQRLRVTAAADKVDSPSIDRVTAWQRGELIFDDTSLSEAAAEFNRYDAGRIAIEGRAGKLRVGGVFRIGDVASFADAMANAYHLRIVNRGSTIVISDPPIESR